MLDLKKLLSSTPNGPAVRTARAKAANATTPVSLKIRLTPLQSEKLERIATERGVSLATILRELIDSARAP